MEITPQRGNQIVNGDSITSTFDISHVDTKFYGALETFESIWTSSDTLPLGPKSWA